MDTVLTIYHSDQVVDVVAMVNKYQEMCLLTVSRCYNDLFCIGASEVCRICLYLEQLGICQ